MKLLGLAAVILTVQACGSQRGHRDCNCPQWSEVETPDQPLTSAPAHWHAQP